MPAKAERPPIPALTGLRFFAAFFILFAHAVDWLAQFQGSTIGSGFSFVAMYGMPLFFVLSGFVVHYNYGQLFELKGLRRATREFAVARIARLFPLYFFFLFISILADDFSDKVAGAKNLYAVILGYYLTLTQSWFYVTVDGKELINWLFPLSWSISTEGFFYLAYLGLVFPILAIRSLRLATWVAIGYAAVAMLAFVLLRYKVDGVLIWAQGLVGNYIGPEQFQDSFYRWLFYFSPYSRLAEFLMGCLASHVYVWSSSRPVTEGGRRRANIVLALMLSLLILFGAFYIDLLRAPLVNEYVKHLALNFLCAPAIGYILFYVARYDTGFTRFLSRPMLLALGETSYSIYLVHTWTIGLFNKAAPELNVFTGVEAVLRIVAAILLTLLLSNATYRLIETPGRRWLRRHLAPRSPENLAGNPQATAAGRAASTPRRLLFTLGVAGALAIVAFIGQAAQSPAVAKSVHRLFVGTRPEIEVVSATYGMSCKNFKVPAPFPNTVAIGNATNPLKASCDGRRHCDFTVDAAKIGDPANSCGKDFVVEYRCADAGASKSASLPAEAHGQTISLDCGPGT